ncbi:hypothetical protein BF93_09885 [Brachybacterium phenoliresistens]|uniref:DUF6630 domain-containing protein n=1 Tax=Brachybacterium phenoliresistens TaxID=396014 RepID=Z9JNK2_9MICO|nr:hypothetical protein [Brachybacterium phenoliresistens]EWS79764.1 hypothetical protein BF93_09885 [Brachybacterium phenoliresistens]
MHEQWMRLCALLEDDPEVAPAVRRALEGSAGADPWEALIDALDEADALAYVQREDTGCELSEALARLPGAKRCGADLEVVADAWGDLTAAIGVADGLFAPHGLRLLHLPEDSEAVPLVLVPVERTEEIVALATRLGHGARPFG